MRKRPLARVLHAITLSAVAGAAVLAPAAAVAADASAADEVDPAESSSSVDPSQEPPADETAEDPDGQENPPEDPAEVPEESEDTEPEEGVEEDVEPPAEVEEETDEAAQPDAEAAERNSAVEPFDVDDLEDIIPDTGAGKSSQPVRVGVDLAEGTFVPAGVTTAGSRLLVTETGPDVEGGSTTTECTTEASTAVGTATYCIFDQVEPEPPRRLPAGVSEELERIAPMSVVIPENPVEAQDPQVYLAERSSTVTVTQLSAPAGLVGDPEPAVVTPCDDETQIIEPFPGEEIEIPVFFCTRQVALMEDTGLPPLATDDAATTEFETPVAIDVLANDDPVAGAPITGLDLTDAPADGAVRVVGSGADATLRYTPADGFAGTDTFGYGYTTPNGVAFATVSVEVEGPAPAAVAPVGKAASVGVLPDTGGPDRSLFGWAAALLVAGVGALTMGSRGWGRRRGLGTD